MTIPFVIDNQQHKMTAVLNNLLAEHKGRALDIATAYFNVGGWQLLREGLDGLGNVRLLLGEELEAGVDLGLREVGAKPVKGLIRDLAKESFNEKTLRLIEDRLPSCARNMCRCASTRAASCMPSATSSIVAAVSNAFYRSLRLLAPPTLPVRVYRPTRSST